MLSDGSHKISEHLTTIEEPLLGSWPLAVGCSLFLLKGTNGQQLEANSQ